MYVMADTAPIIGASVRIPKDALDSHDIERIRRDLTFRVGGEGRYGFGAKAHTTMMYDDSGEWMTVPRAYGMRLLRDLRGVAGMDAIDVMSSGMPAEFTFDEELQSKRPFMKSIQDRLVGTTVRKLTGGIPGGILCAPCGCHAAGERVLMANGTSKKVEDVEVGDLLIGIDGPRRVLELHRGRQRMVRITPNKGESFVVNLGHILTVMWSVSDGARRDGELIDIPVSEWILSSKNFKRHTVLYRPEVESFDGNDVNVYDLINPYWLGLLLGDGSIKRSPAITTKDAEILTEIQHMAKWFGLIVRKDTHDGRCPTYYFTCGKRGGGAHHDQNVLVTKLKELGLWGTSARTKFVPDQYKYGSSAVRRQVLAGLIDTDGSLTRGCFEFSSASEQLADDVTFMSRSLGLAAHKTQKRVVGEIYWKVMISGHCSTIPTRIHRKKCPKRPINKDARRVGIKSTTLLPEDTYYGFVVNGDHRYLMADFTLTHNTGKTVMGCKVASELGTTTLILAHKEFLVDQWRDRISTWLKMPQDEIGIVQQNRCDYHGKRIVVAMLQSIVERDYDPELYSWPGLLIADEVHRHGADLWHKAAMRFTSKYRLGLTATPTRKDGMWDVVRNNFGEILAKDSGEAMQPTVYVVRYVPRFALSRYAWAQGNPIGYTRVKKIYLGKFITLLTEDPARNRMLVQILMKAFREGRKNLVLTDRREHIETLKKMITAEDKTATVGRYVGGMSPKARALSEQCQIILGTFQMASEALDIPALDAGILATPHADVEQAVGRICRLQDEKKQPVLVDIFDDEQYIGRPLFEKRERFFQSRGWPIRYIGG